MTRRSVDPAIDKKSPASSLSVHFFTTTLHELTGPDSMRTIFDLRSVMLAAGCLFWVIGVSIATDEKAERRQQYESWKKEYDQKHAEFIKAVEAGTATAEEVAKSRSSVEDFGERFMKLAKKNPADAVGCDALVWVASHGKSKDLDDAIRLIEKHHLNSPKLKEVILHLGYSESGMGLIAQLVEKGGTPEVRGLASFYSAIQRYGLYWLSRKSDPKELAAIERLLERVEKDYADVRVDQGKTIGQLAKGWLYQIKHLQPGMKAPEIEGSGVDGKKMKLSDFKGKVVLLVFWSSSCGPCLADVPHHRKMMEDFARRPFTIVGVCCGDEKEQAAKTMTKEKMTWPSFLDGDLDEGRICQQWNVDALPTVYLIDSNGVILRNHPLNLSEEADAFLVWNAILQAEGK
jgi:peroxiredoxin